MSDPTAGEIALSKRLRLDPKAMALAREVLNIIAVLPWPKPERVSLLVRLARGARADVGTVYAGMALDIAPLKSFDALMPVLGLAEKRVAGLTQALSTFDLAELSPGPSTILLSTLDALQAKLAALQTENDALRTELDRLYAKLAAEDHPGGPSAVAVMRLGDVASSISSQVGAVDDALRSSSYGLRLGGLELTVKGAATSLDNDVALDFGSSSAGSEVNLAFVPADLSAARANTGPVPDVRGYTPALARRKLVAAGFAVTFATAAGAKGVVQEQSPADGTIARVGSVVRLIVR